MENEAKSYLNELKSIYALPKLYLADFFIDLKSQVDFLFQEENYNNNNEKFKQNWIEIIKQIESFEQDTYKRNTTTLLNEFKSEIKQLDDGQSSISLIIELKSKIEKCLFSNKTICFINKSLIIVQDEYLSADCIFSIINELQSVILTNELIKVIYLLKTKLKNDKLEHNNYYSINKFNLNFNNLKELILRDSNINQIEDGSNTFKCLIHLELLDLSLNCLTEINVNIFNSKDLANLIELNLGNNKITLIQDKSFVNLIKLEKLFLYSNKLTQINKATFEGLCNLNELSLRYNFISFIQDDSFENLKKLEILHFGGIKYSDRMTNNLYLDNELTQITRNTFNGLGNLKELNISWNRLSSIQNDAFQMLHNLEELDLSANEINELNENTFNGLNNLKVLKLYSNRIDKIDENSFDCLDKLEKLHIGKQRLKELNANVFNKLCNLKELSLRENMLSSIDNLFNNLYSLKRLNLQNNNINFIDLKTFNNLTNLKLLNLSSNQMGLINGELFVKLVNLKTLILADNKIKVINCNSLCGLNNLIDLDLSGNLISSIDQDVFQDLIKLEKLWLNNNDINKLELYELERLDNLKEIYYSQDQMDIFDQITFDQNRNIQKILFFDEVDE